MHIRKSYIFMFMMLLLGSMFLTQSLATYSDETPKIGARVDITADDVDKIAAAGASVRLSGTVKNDVYLAGALIDTNASIGGDYNAFGSKVELTGAVEGDANIAGAEVIVDAKIDDELNAMGASVIVQNTTTIGDDASVSAALVEFYGQAGNNLKLMGDEILFDGKVTGDLTLEGNEIELSETANIQGDLLIRSNTDAIIPAGTTITGEVTQTDLPDYEAEAFEKGPFSGFKRKLMIASSSFLLGLFLLFVTRNTAEEMISTLQTQPGMSILWGTAIFFALPVFTIFCLFTVFGVPLGLTLMFTIPFLILLGFTTALLGLSDWLLNKYEKPKQTKQRILFFALALVIYLVVRLVPMLGALIVFIAMLFGLGAMIISFGNRLRSINSSPNSEVTPIL